MNAPRRRRVTGIMKKDELNGGATIVCTYRTRRLITWKFAYKTVIFSGTHDALLMDWNSEEDALKGHEQVMARLQRGEPVAEIEKGPPWWTKTLKA